jgi:hypothetical protein
MRRDAIGQFQKPFEPLLALFGKNFDFFPSLHADDFVQDLSSC